MTRWLSCVMVVAIAVIVHIDWHVGRPVHIGHALGWSLHWIIAIPTFALVTHAVRSAEVLVGVDHLDDAARHGQVLAQLAHLAERRGLGLEAAQRGDTNVVNAISERLRRLDDADDTQK